MHLTLSVWPKSAGNYPKLTLSKLEYRKSASSKDA